MKKNLLIASMLIASAGVFAQTPRLCLYEEFTGETCPPCAATNPGLNALLALPTNTAKCVALKWQVPIPSAPTKTWSLYQTNKTEIDWRYRSTASGGYGYAINSAPSGKMDGQDVTVFGASSSHPANLNSNVIATAQSYTSAFNIDMKHEYNSTRSAIIVTVDIAATANFNAIGNLVFRCVMVEKVIQFSVQPGTNGETHFEDVAIKSYPSIQNGTAMSPNWTSGQTQSFVLTCNLPSYVRNPDQIGMVGFIQDDGNRKVAQAARSKTLLDAAVVNASVPDNCVASVSPTVTLSNMGTNVITTMTLTPSFDGTSASPVTWAGSLAPGASTTIVLSNLTAPSVAGAHKFACSVVANDGNDFIAGNDAASVKYMYGTNAANPMITEDFVSSSSPAPTWLIVNDNNGPSWTRVTNAGMYVTPAVPLNSIKYDFFNNKVMGDVDAMMLPPADLRGGSAPLLTFDMSYASRDTYTDLLEVKVSSDCGANWSTVLYENSGMMALSVNSSNYVPNPFNEADWSSREITLTGFNVNNVLVKFVVTNGNGNNLYIDNINLRQTNGVGVKENGAVRYVSLYPNPAHGATTLKVETLMPQAGSISVVNMLGQVVYTKDVMLNGGENTFSIETSDFAAGVYNVSVQTAEGKTVVKLNVN